MMMTKAKTIIGGLATAAVLSASMLVATPAAEAKNMDWKHNQHHSHHWNGNSWDNGANFLIPGIIGFAAGAAIGQASHGGGYCERRFQSYNPRTHQYLGYDGAYHACFD
jgi:hypothetical protein